jgi:hypothetical protein
MLEIFQTNRNERICERNACVWVRDDGALKNVMMEQDLQLTSGTAPTKLLLLRNKLCAPERKGEMVPSR